MQIHFYKYQGTGNDFVMLDNMNGEYDGLSLDQIRFLCHRKLGVGADGLIKLSANEKVDFTMEYFNADGTQSFCGNGARCTVAFARDRGYVNHQAVFDAIDGRHASFIEKGIVRIEMLPVKEVEKIGGDYLLDTGSPHYVSIQSNSENVDIVDYGKQVRYSERFKEKGVNVNTLSEIEPKTISVQTYERGVEDETLSCGTGVTACALVQMLRSDLTGQQEIRVHTKGGELTVNATRDAMGTGFSEVWLSGPAKGVFKGEIDV